jgi:GNAT superfamily N-acetyltransferase
VCSLIEGLSIRNAALEDIAAILGLYAEAGLESGRPFTEEEARAHFAVFSLYPWCHLFVAEADRKIVGTYELLIMDCLAKHGQRSGIVEDVAVSSRHQGRGVGRAMMEHAMQQCRNAGCYKMVLSSGMRRTRAHDFYVSAGFERHGFSFRVLI